jgi:hypothetical protein
MLSEIRSPALWRVAYVGDSDELPPAWLGQDVVALDPSRCVALVVPRNNTAHWCALAGWQYIEVQPVDCPMTFGKCADVTWDEAKGIFAVTALREPFGPTVAEAPYFGYGADEGRHDFWGVTEYTPAGVVVRYQLAEPNGDGTFFPMPIVEVRFEDWLDGERQFHESAVNQARAYLREVIANIDIGGLGLRGFSQV